MNYYHHCRQHLLPINEQFKWWTMRIQLLIFSIVLMMSQLRAELSYGQRLTIRAKGLALEQVMKEIKKQSGYGILYNPHILAKDGAPVSLSVSDASLQTVLEEIFKHQDKLEYLIDQRDVIVRPRSQASVSIVETMQKVQQDSIRGRITNDKGEPLNGASIYVLDAQGRRTAVQTKTDEGGSFELIGIEDGTMLEVFYLGFTSIKVASKPQIGNIALKPFSAEVEEVMVNTGYQTIPKERTVGSYNLYDSQLLMDQVAPNILDRLDGNSSILFDRRNSSNTKIQIRGVYSIMDAMVKPLIILDDFPYEGDLESINPADVANITVLKDAAAASIWGVRAGNGVIVITTKKGTGGVKRRIEGSATWSVSPQPSLIDRPIMNASAHVDMEIDLFAKGYFTPQINNVLQPPLYPVVDVLDARRKNQITAADSASAIDALRSRDIRHDLSAHFYRSNITQQYNTSLSSSTERSRYRISLGYNKIMQHLIGDDDDRFVGRWNHTFDLTRSTRLDMGVNLSRSTGNNNSLGAFAAGSWRTQSGQLLPVYQLLVDRDGQPQQIYRRFRSSHVELLSGQKLLDWTNYPMQELDRNDNRILAHGVVTDIGLTQRLWAGMDVSIKYQYQRERSEGNNYYALDSYFARDLINNYTNLSATSAHLIHPIPVGGVLDYTNGETASHNVRGQLNYARKFSDLHRLDGMSGIEFRKTDANTSSGRHYGYDDNAFSRTVDYIGRYPTYQGSQLTIPFLQNLTDTRQRFVSYYANASYSFRETYTVFASGRMDAANIFGIDIRGQWRPLWSIGGAWDVAKEAFLSDNLFKTLKLRASHGYSGNIYQNQTAYTTFTYFSANPLTQLTYASIFEPGNPALRWEQVRTTNLGMDIGMPRVTLSVEYYNKMSTDVFGTQTLDPTTGINNMITNSAGIRGKGVEAQLSIDAVVKRRWRWTPLFAFNYNRYVVEEYNNDNVVQFGYVSDGATLYPLVTHNPYSVVSHRWGGLDPATGAPRGIFNGQPSMDYNTIIRTTPNEDQALHGSALPLYFGNLRNTVQFDGLSLSCNLVYRLDYYFRKPSLNYARAAGRLEYLPAEYADRWQKPGDEMHTDVPSFIYPINSTAATFYEFSEINVDRGDHIRLRDIRLDYRIDPKLLSNFKISNAQIGINYFGNHILWRKNRFGLDPDNAATERMPSIFTFDLRFTF